jgi:hypothetical protein
MTEREGFEASNARALNGFLVLVPLRINSS